MSNANFRSGGDATARSVWLKGDAPANRHCGRKAGMKAAKPIRYHGTTVQKRDKKAIIFECSRGGFRSGLSVCFRKFTKSSL